MIKWKTTFCRRKGGGKRGLSMGILTQIGIFFGICLLGEGVAAILPFPFPPSVIAMAALFVLLCAKGLKPAHIQQTGDFLLKNMAFFFIPAGVGILENIDALKGALGAFFAVCALTTVVVFFAAALAARGAMALQRKWKGERE